MKNASLRAEIPAGARVSVLTPDKSGNRRRHERAVAWTRVAGHERGRSGRGVARTTTSLPGSSLAKPRKITDPRRTHAHILPSRAVGAEPAGVAAPRCRLRELGGRTSSHGPSVPRAPGVALPDPGSVFLRRGARLRGLPVRASGRGAGAGPAGSAPAGPAAVARRTPRTGHSGGRWGQLTWPVGSRTSWAALAAQVVTRRIFKRSTGSCPREGSLDSGMPIASV